jgi:hypothetical protein
MTATPQARKLGLKAETRVALDAPPLGWRLADPPAGLLAPDDDGAADVIIAFFLVSAAIAPRLPILARRVFPAGAVWALWPRRAAGHVSDITDNVVRSCALELGLVDVKVAAVDEDWSGLRLVWRNSNRSAAVPGRRDPRAGKLRGEKNLRAVSDWRRRRSWERCRGLPKRAPTTRRRPS